MSGELLAWLAYEGRAFPDGEWRDYLRAFNIKWARTRSTAAIPTWYAIEGKGYVVWVSVPRWGGNRWRIALSVLESAPSGGRALVDEVVSSALVRFPTMRLEKRLSADSDAAG
jgi:hypothetical protein